MAEIRKLYGIDAVDRAHEAVGALVRKYGESEEVMNMTMAVSVLILFIPKAERTRPTQETDPE